jgi:hypothetical protein
VLGLQGKFDDMKTVSGAAAPEQVVDQNVALLQGLIQPVRSWDALAEKPAPVRVAETLPGAEAQIAEPVTGVDGAAAAQSPGRTLRLRN